MPDYAQPASVYGDSISISSSATAGVGMARSYVVSHLDNPDMAEITYAFLALATNNLKTKTHVTRIKVKPAITIAVTWPIVKDREGGYSP